MGSFDATKYFVATAESTEELEKSKEPVEVEEDSNEEQEIKERTLWRVSKEEQLADFIDSNWDRIPLTSKMKKIDREHSACG